MSALRIQRRKLGESKTPFSHRPKSQVKAVARTSRCGSLVLFARHGDEALGIGQIDDLKFDVAQLGKAWRVSQKLLKLLDGHLFGLR